MTTWATVLVASVASFVVKLLGHVVPERWVAGRRTRAVSGLLPVALLSALVATQMLVGPGGAVVLDARVAGLMTAVVLLWRGAGFVPVVVGAAAVTALLRLAGVA